MKPTKLNVKELNWLMRLEKVLESFPESLENKVTIHINKEENELMFIGNAELLDKTSDGTWPLEDAEFTEIIKEDHCVVVYNLDFSFPDLIYRQLDQD